MMGAWIKLVMALLNRGACWTGQDAQTTRCTLY